MKSYWHEPKTTYDGKQLSSLFAYRNFSVQGDSIVGFRGECNVQVESMVDIADVKDNAFIYSKDMLHFIIEIFELDLEKAVFYQRMLVAIVKETIEFYLVKADKKLNVLRIGDDLYIGDKKLSVSIATLSPVSSMIHFGINILSIDTPVPTMSLVDLMIEPIVFAREVMQRYITEIDSIKMAKCKVRGVN